ncbi:MAG: M20/M25/M40 family metallo-hydrolase, partial [Flavobacteriaceae bacterium]|nr:M20/M25/M40 family metallo-hydrolase [Flavobacteriaceae bacterium]
MNRISTLLIAAYIFGSFGSFAQIEINELDSLSLKYAKQSFPELREFFSIPNDANYPEQIEPNVKWVEKAFEARGFTTERLETSTVPIVLASSLKEDAKKTVLVYLQIDGQPVDTSKWFQDDPYIPALKKQDSNNDWAEIPWNSLDGEINHDWRIFSRSASDARGPVMMFLKAYDLLKDRGIEPDFNLKVVMDFEEELGSPQLPNAVNVYKDKLAADMLVIFDGPRHLSNEPTLTYGARGIATITLEVFGPRTPVHSGNYGNFVPNPAVKLSQLLATMWDKDGRVTIPTWYDGISISEKVKKTLENVP